MKLFGAKLNRLRKENSLTLGDLSKMLGYSSHTYLSELERGHKTPTTTFILKVAKIFKVTTDYLLDDTQPIIGEE